MVWFGSVDVGMGAGAGAGVLLRVAACRVLCSVVLCAPCLDSRHQHPTGFCRSGLANRLCSVSRNRKCIEIPNIFVSHFGKEFGDEKKRKD